MAGVLVYWLGPSGAGKLAASRQRLEPASCLLCGSAGRLMGTSAMCALANCEVVRIAKASLSPAAAGLDAAAVPRVAAASSQPGGAVAHSAAQTLGVLGENLRAQAADLGWP